MLGSRQTCMSSHSHFKAPLFYLPDFKNVSVRQPFCISTTLLHNVAPHGVRLNSKWGVIYSTTTPLDEISKYLNSSFQRDMK